MKIAIITGGETAERDISIKSAKNVQDAISFAEIELFTFPEDKERFESLSKSFDLAIPVIHGLGGEDGTLQKFLGRLVLPFIFSDATTHEIAIDKKLTKERVRVLGINTPSDIDFFPAFIKPRTGGSSVASKLCVSLDETKEIYNSNSGTEFMQEEPIRGREFTVGILEYQNTTFALPIIEIIPKSDFFDFESKYDPNKLADEICPAEIDDPLSQELQRQALAVHTHLKARHISRSDFIVTPDNKVYFLEINTIPGMTATSLVPKMLRAANISLTDVLKDWCITN